MQWATHLHLDVSTMCPGQLSCDAEAQTGPLPELVLAGLDLDKGLEEAAQVVLADAHTLVGCSHKAEVNSRLLPWSRWMHDHRLGTGLAASLSLSGHWQTICSDNSNVTHTH